LFLLAGGWGGLALILTATQPTVWPRWAFYALTVMAVTGTALPLSYFVNRRLMFKELHVVTRQAVWAGLYAALLVWLKAGQALSFSVALWIVLFSVVVEYLFQMRERAVRGPGRPVQDE
jgi:hypothetical protein